MQAVPDGASMGGDRMSNDYTKAKPDVLREIIREAEAYIDGQLSLATSADQRASVMASVFAAAGTVIAAALMTVAAGTADAQFVPIFTGGGVAAVLFVLGASFCVKATLPVGFALPGSQPESWLRDIKNRSPLAKSLAEQAANFQDKIEGNRKVLVSNARWFKTGAWAGISAPIAGFAGWVAMLFIIRCSA